jgi:DNA-binding transcriptional LysR family regulator
MDTLVSMKVFRQVAELGSFVRTAEKLRISTAMTSKHVQHLESHLGVRLFHRTSRRVSLTDEGRFYLTRCTEILAEIEETEAALTSAHTRPIGVLRVAAPVWMCDEAFATTLSRYHEQYPEVELELVLADRTIDLVEESIDVALRVTAEPHETLLARRICEVPLVMVGSPAYLARKGRPTQAEDLAHHPMIVNNNLAHSRSLSYLTPEGPRQIPLQVVMSTNNTHLIAQSAACGMGLAMLPGLLLREASLASRLEQVLPELQWPTNLYLYAVYTSRRFQSPKVRTFIDFISMSFRETPPMGFR